MVDMIATNDNNFGSTDRHERGYYGTGTADVDFAEVEHCIAAAIVELNRCERERMLHECWLQLQEKLGAQLDKCGWQILYWQPRHKQQRVASQVLLRKPLIVLAGHMDRSRGIHWNRR